MSGAVTSTWCACWPARRRRTAARAANRSSGPGCRMLWCGRPTTPKPPGGGIGIPRAGRRGTGGALCRDRPDCLARSGALVGSWACFCRLRGGRPLVGGLLRGRGRGRCHEWTRLREDSRDLGVQRAQLDVRLFPTGAQSGYLLVSLVDHLVGLGARRLARLLRVGVGRCRQLTSLGRLFAAAQSQRYLEVLLGGLDAVLQLGLLARLALRELVLLAGALGGRLGIEPLPDGLRLEGQLILLDAGTSDVLLELGGDLRAVPLDVGDALPERLVRFDVPLGRLGHDLLGLEACVRP